MTKCQKCNHDNPPDATFCNKCGSQIERPKVFRPGIAPAWVDAKEETDLDILRQDTPEKRATAEAMANKLVRHGTTPRPVYVKQSPQHVHAAPSHRRIGWIISTFLGVVVAAIAWVGWGSVTHRGVTPTNTPVPPVAFSAKLSSWLTVDELPTSPPIRGKHGIVTLTIENLTDHAIDIECRLSWPGGVIMADSRYSDNAQIQPGQVTTSWAFPLPSSISGLYVMVIGLGEVVKIPVP